MPEAPHRMAEQPVGGVVRLLKKETGRLPTCQKEEMMAVTCPECDNPIDIDEDDVEEGETVTCDECGTELEVISTDPLQISIVDAEGYDDEDEGPHHRGGDDEDDD